MQIKDKTKYTRWSVDNVEKTKNLLVKAET